MDDHRRSKSAYQKLEAEFASLQQSHHETQRALQAEQSNLDTLRQQNLMLKQQISISSRVDEQMPDDEVRSSMDSMFHVFQGFAVSALREEKLDVDRIPHDAKAWLDIHVLDTDAPSKSSHIHIVTSLISRVLVECFNPRYHFGVSSDLPVSAAASLALFIQADTTEGKMWLQSTWQLLRSYDERAISKSERRLIESAVQEIYRTLANALPIDWTAARRRLYKTFSSACVLFRKLRDAKALFRIEMAPVVRQNERLLFQPKVMTAVDSAEDDTELAGRTIAASVFPGLYKYGDEFGEELAEMVVICKARVVIHEDAKPAETGLSRILYG